MGLQDLTPQLRTRLRRVEKIVSLFVALATLVLISGFVYYLYHTASRKGWFVPKCPYYTFVMSAEGLKVGDPIILMGFSVGQITVIEAQPPASYYGVYLGFEIRRPYYGYIWTDSKVKITAADFLGRRQLEIIKGYNGKATVYEENNRISKILVKGKQVPLSEEPKGIFMKPDEQPTLTDRAEKLVAQVESALPNILSLTNQLNSILSNSAQLTANLNQIAADARPVVTNLAVITANISDPHGSLGEWIIPTNINAQISLALSNVNSTLIVSLNETLLNIAAITSNLNAQVQANDQILSEISDLIVETDDMMQGLKRHWLLKGAFPQQGEPARDLLLEPQIVPQGGDGR